MIDDKYLDSLTKFININEHNIEYDYKGKKNQILIPKELTTKIYLFIKKIEDEDNIKESIKHSIRKIFDLYKNDLVLFKNGSIFIKLFEEKYSKEVKEEVKGTIANRFNGLDESELKSFYDEFFSYEEHNNFFQLVSKEFVHKYIYQQNITNDTYEKNVFKYIQNITFEHLTAIYDNSDGFFNAFAGYVFRIHFKEVFEKIADLLLEAISKGDKPVYKFLEYYSAGIIVSNGKKYKVPTIQTKDGAKWNLVSMLSIAKIYSKTISTIKLLKINIEQENKKISKLYINNLSPIQYQNNILKSKKEFEINITNTKKELEKLSDSIFQESNKTKIKTLENKKIDLIDYLAKLQKEKQSILSKKPKREIIQQYTQLQKELDTMNRQLSIANKTIKQNQQSYLTLRDSLVKSLISKKQKIVS